MIKKILKILALLLLVAYVGVSFAYTRMMSDRQLCSGVQIEVRDSACHRFVTAEQVARELGDLPAHIKGKPINAVNTDTIERMLRSIDKIENVSVLCLTDGRIYITVNPMQPVARIFPNTGYSYYINRTGKCISANPMYHMDVPVIQGDFSDTAFAPGKLLPLLDWLDAHPEWNSLVSSIKVDSPNDVMLMPVIRGHVINLGNLSSLDDKFARLHAFYRQVMPVRGYETFDTLSVKWSGQVVATLRDRKLPDFNVDKGFDEDVPDINTMLATQDTAPVPGIRPIKLKK